MSGYKQNKRILYCSQVEKRQTTHLYFNYGTDGKKYALDPFVRSGSGPGSGREIIIFGSAVGQSKLNDAESDPDDRGKPTNFFLIWILA
jgi:hypothetical protein